MKFLKLIVIAAIAVLLNNNCLLASGYQDGIQAYNQGNYILAEKIFRKALVSEPNNVKMRYYMAISLVKNKKIQEAKYNYRYILNTSPKSDVGYWAKVGLEMLNGGTSRYASPSSGNPSLGRADINKAEISLDANGSSIIVKDVLLNGSQSANFIMDTGATYTLISTSLARKLGIDTYNAPKINLITVNGKVSAPRVILDSVEVNGLRARNVQATVYDFDSSGHSQGLLGLSFLHNFKVTIDRSAGKVTLEKN